MCWFVGDDSLSAVSRGTGLTGSYMAWSLQGLYSRTWHILIQYDTTVCGPSRAPQMVQSRIYGICPSVWIPFLSPIASHCVFNSKYMLFCKILHCLDVWGCEECCYYYCYYCYTALTRYELSQLKVDELIFATITEINHFGFFNNRLLHNYWLKQVDMYVIHLLHRDTS